MSPSVTSADLKSYRTRPYENDGGFSVNGLFLTTAAGVLVALLMGVVAGWVGQFFYAIIIFPLAIGLAVGAAQTWVIRYTKIRTPLVCAASGLIAGIVAVTTVHFFNYHVFRDAMSEIALEEQSLRQSITLASDPQEREYLQEALRGFEADPDILAVKEVGSFTSYLDFSARQGVEISPGHGASKGLNLGYTGTYVYWGAEAVIVAIISAGVARRRAGAPFCAKCDVWKNEREIGSLHGSAKALGEIIQSGRLSDLPLGAATAGEEVSISVCECPQCSAEEEVVLQVDRVTYNNGNRTKSLMARTVYPRAAREELTGYFAAASAEGGARQL